ncbi:MAG: TIGR04552 family protein [Bdellovibrionaceae bacterium]|nr:TIGR04552 family protein [Pseudobdellovibrionaceae bacterium]
MASQPFDFSNSSIDHIFSRQSSIDLDRLKIKTLEEAYQFIASYGYDLEKEADQTALWNFHRRAVTFIETDLLVEGEQIPADLSDPRKLKDLGYLLIYASNRSAPETSMQNWACAIIRVMHVLVHLENDIFYLCSDDIQDQILNPIRHCVSKDPIKGLALGSGAQAIPLKKFEIKPFKTSTSSIVKLLIKPQAVAFRLLDKIGVRFVTKNVHDVFRVIRYLVENNVINFSHNIPDQSSNSLFPGGLFLEVMEEIKNKKNLKPEQIDQLLFERLEGWNGRDGLFRKPNEFSSQRYKFVKFISRRRIQTVMNGQAFSFFYPFEIQLMDYSSFLENEKGAADHKMYKGRQRRRARARILGFGDR